jgi:hypothetical protein
MRPCRRDYLRDKREGGGIVKCIPRQVQSDRVKMEWVIQVCVVAPNNLFCQSLHLNTAVQ